MLFAPTRRNWTKITEGAYHFLVEAEGQPMERAFAQAKSEYSFEFSEVAHFLSELRTRGIIYFDIDKEPRPGAPDPSGVSTKAVFLNVTTRCNLRCPTCLANASASAESDEAPTSVWQEIMDKLADAGVSTVIVTGGEPTMRKDIFDLLRYARDRFGQVYMNTNGTLLTPEICGQLRGLVDRIHVSVDGSTAEIHDWFRGKGNFNRAIQGTQFLKGAGVEHIGLSPTLTGVNIQDLPNMVDLSISLGVALRTSVFLPVGRGACNASVLTPSTQQLVDVFRDTHVALLGHSDDELENQKQFMVLQPTTPRLNCGAGRWTVSVTGDGMVYPCNALWTPDHVMGNLLEAESLTGLVRESHITRQLDAITVDKRVSCRSCDVRYLCGGGCVAHSYIRHSDLQAVDPFCDFYRQVLRAMMWTHRANASPRENVQAMVDWLSPGSSMPEPVEVRWDARTEVLESGAGAIAP
jgi:radical SAM protein with 4Fe4S-binding SPASM domain